jgi:Protein of unknown function (DUF4019)
MMQNTLRRVAGLAAALFASVAFAQDNSHAGDDFLRLLDTKKYAESWDASSDLLKKSVSRAEWTTQVTKARDTLGDLASRKLKDMKPETNPPGAPPGEYLLMTYETVFASQGAPHTETLPLIKEPDGRWRAVGYFVR